MSNENSDGDAFTAGAAEAARLAREVQDLGFATARSIVERFVEMCTQFTATNRDEPGPQGDHGERPFWFGGSGASMQQMQSDMLRASEAYLAVMTQFNEASLRFLDPGRWSSAPSADHEDLVLPQVAPGGRASARLWLHNTTAEAASDLRAWCPGLVSHSGATIPSVALTCQPERIDRLEPDASCELVVTVVVAEDTAPGTYHGQLLVDGLPDVVFPIRVQVRPATDG
jgi:hypothetical protein